MRVLLALYQRIAEGAGGKGPRQKASNIVKKFQKFFDTFRQFSRRAKIVKKHQKVFRHFSTIFALGTFFPAPFGGL